MIPTAELVIGTIYELNARNLTHGVWTGTNFIGIRYKFGVKFLDVEFPITGSYYPTACATKVVGVVPENVPLTETLGTGCKACGADAWWTGPPAPAPWACKNGCKMVDPIGRSNIALFDLLSSLK